MKRTIMVVAAVVAWLVPLESLAFDGRIVGHWRCNVTKPEGNWVLDWIVQPGGAYHCDVKGPGKLPNEDGQMTCENGRWNLRATNGRNESGSYSLNGDTLTWTTPRDTTKWVRVTEKPIVTAGGGAQQFTLPAARVNSGLNENIVVRSGQVNPAARALFDQALKAKETGKNERAVQLLTMALKTSPGFVEARYQRGVCLNRMVLHDESAGQLTMRLLPKSIFGKANMIWMAIDDFNAVIGLQPNNAKAICMRGLCYSESMQWKQAIKDFDRAIALDPSYNFPYGYRAIVHINTFQPEGDDLQKAIALDPSYTDYWQNEEKNAREFRHEYKAFQEAMDRKMAAAAAGGGWSDSSTSSNSSSDWSPSDRARANADNGAAQRLDYGNASYAEKAKYGGW